MRENWTDEQSKLLEDHYLSKGGRWCARQTGKSIASVNAKARRMGIARTLEERRRDSTPEIDKVIIRAYASEEHGAVKRCANSVRRPYRWVSKRAAELGLATRERNLSPVSDEESRFMRENAHLTRRRISQIMSKKGWKRSAAFIQRYLQRDLIESEDSAYMGTSGVAELCRVDHATVLNWIRRDLLRAERRDGGESLVQGEMRGKNLAIHEREIARFAVNHPLVMPLRRVDPVWFVDLIARWGGTVLYDAETKIDRLRRIVEARPELRGDPAQLAGMIDSTPNSVTVMMSRINAQARSVAA